MVTARSRSRNTALRTCDSAAAVDCVAVGVISQLEKDAGNG
jgi:hypothetical protein